MDPNVFFRHEDLQKQINALANCDNEAAQAQSVVSSTTQQIANTENVLRQKQHASGKLKKRLHRNENPRFFHYMQFNRKKKVDRLKGELDTLIGECSQIEGSIPPLRDTLGQQQEVLNRSKNVVAHRNTLTQERDQIFESVVNANPSARLQQIRVNEQAQGDAIRKEQALLQQLGACATEATRGQQQYSEAMRLMQAAERYNTTARVINRAEFENEEDYKREQRRLREWERREQGIRDNMINEAQIPANNGYTIIAHAWQLFPAEARIRYPQLSSQIGHVPLPQLLKQSAIETSVMDMMGDIGTAVNNASVQSKIRQNMQTIAECQRILGQQQQLIAALKSAILASAAKMEDQLNVLKQQDKEEQNVIFSTIRNGTMQRSAVATAVPIATATHSITTDNAVSVM